MAGLCGVQLMKTPRLRGDLYGLFGIRGDGLERHRVYEIEKGDLDRLRGVRCDWMIVFEEPDNKTLKEHLMPMLVAGSYDEIQAAQKGKPITTTPVIYYAPPMKRLFPL